jgi:PAS domain S-box-containing protein
MFEKPMIPKPPHTGTNALLEALPADQRQRFLGVATAVSLESGKVIADAEQPIQYVYFPTTAVLSILSVTTAKMGVETAVVGYEGMSPLAVFHQVDRTAEQVVVQVPGDALRMTREDFHAALAESPVMRVQLQKYAQALFTFAAQSSACNRQHPVMQRCARWLLTTHDRVPGDQFHLTHLFLSQMLGIRRSSVTVSAEVLRSAGAITYTRGRIHVTNRDELLERSCECYAIVRSTYDRLLNGTHTASPLASLELSIGGDSILGGGHPSEGSAAALAMMSPEASFSEFSGRLREVRSRTEALRKSGERTSGPVSTETAEHLFQELDVALEQLSVAEEEMRVQMESLSEMRTALETQHQQWRARFDGLPDAFLETDQDDTIVEMNGAAEDLLGKSRRSVIGKPLLSLIPDTERRSLRNVIGDLRSGATRGQWRGPIMRQDERPTVDIAVAASSTLPAAGPAKFVGARWLVRPAARAR